MTDNSPLKLDEALAAAAAQMLQEIDRQRAECRVQLIANGHKATDVYRHGEAGAVTYEERLAELEKALTNLANGLSPPTYERAQQLASGPPSVAGQS